MISNPDIEFDIEFDEKGKLIEEKTEPLILKYLELEKKYKYNQVLNENFKRFFVEHRDIISNSNVKNSMCSWQVIDNVKCELSNYKYSDEQIVNILVKYLYDLSNSNNKALLWRCYGDIILNNIKNNIDIPKTKFIKCIDCGSEFEIAINNKRTCRCISCNAIHKREVGKEKMRRHRARK